MKTMDVLKEVLAGKRMSASSKSNYGLMFRSLDAVCPEFPSKSVEVNRWLVGLSEYSNQTVRLYYSLLKSASEYMEANFGMVNPCKAMVAPKIGKQRRRYFKAEELVRLVEACSNNSETALIMTLIDSACRIGGLGNLKGGDVEQGFINVKEKTGQRRYRLDERVCALLKSLAGGDNNLVFGVNSQSLAKRVRRLCKRAGLTGAKLGPHTIRHSSASIVARDTENALAVKALLQHDSIQTSMIYIHDVEEELQKNISPLEIIERTVGDRSYKPKQIPMVSGEGVVDGTEVVDGEVVSGDNGGSDLVNEMFPEIEDGVEIRPLLRSADLAVVRQGFIEMYLSGQYSNEVGLAMKLMRRMLRKVK